jgi:hypothetical protein
MLWHRLNLTKNLKFCESERPNASSVALVHGGTPFALPGDMTPQTDPEEFVCDICGAELDSVSDLNEHKEEHMLRGRSRDEEQQNIRGDIGAAGLPGNPLP